MSTEPIISAEDARKMLKLENQRGNPSFESPRSRVFALLLCVFFGFFGLHKFYVGRRFSAFMMFISLGYFGIGVIFDALLILFGIFRDGKKQCVSSWWPRANSGEFFSLFSSFIFLAFILGGSFLAVKTLTPIAIRTARPVLEAYGIDIDSDFKKVLPLLSVAKNVIGSSKSKDSPFSFISENLTERLDLYNNLDPEEKKAVKEKAIEVIKSSEVNTKIKGSLDSLKDAWKKSRTIAPKNTNSKSTIYSNKYSSPE